tara:strand:+ start:1919 stop:2794 length:876 start_codon:yes stop_codon:yes gene_type:complete
MDDFITKCDDLKDFDSGAKRDNPEGKGAYELISPLALRRLALVYERGATQKGARNWEAGFPMSRGMQSAIRHIFQYLGGIRDEDHIAQACWNLFTVIHFEEMVEKGLLPEKLNDLPNYQTKEEFDKKMAEMIKETTNIGMKEKSIKKPEIKTRPTKFYLAHPFDARYRVRGWELEFEKKTGFDLLNPFYEGSDNVGIENVNTGRQERYEKIDADKLIERDIDHIKDCDGVIAIIDGSLSYGTIQEMVYAKINEKPVITVVLNGHENHPWLRHHSNIIVNDLDRVEQAVRDL